MICMFPRSASVVTLRCSHGPSGLLKKYPKSANAKATGISRSRQRRERVPWNGIHAKLAGRTMEVARFVPQPGWIASSLFAAAQAGHGFMDRSANIFRGHLTKQEKPGGVGMPGKIFVVVFACKDFKRGMFHSMVAPCCK